jgi:2-polyprenyl-6-methoxyphenol hydroxylase-like FAD-dependent oxidoreductase
MNNEVLIVGAGPVGLTLACELARYGVAVRIVDKAAQRTDKSKALVLWSRTLELLDRGADSSPFVAAGLKVDAANMVAGNKLIGRVSLSEIASRYAFALMLPQSETERLLEERLNGLGVRVERQCEMIRFEPTEAGVACLLRGADGAEETAHTPWLVGCDGAHSAVRHGLDMPFLGKTLLSDWILADVRLTGAPYPLTEIVTFMHEDGVLVMFPIAPGRYRIIADVGLAQGERPADPTLPQVQALVDRRGPPGVLLSDPIWLSGFRINERKVADYWRGRVFLAGDAAHVHSPAGGQGMNTGMQDAFNLAWKLALVARGKGAERLLFESYSRERSAVGDQVLAAAGRLTAIGVLKNHTAQTVRNLIGGLLLGLAPVRRAMAETLSEITIGYPESPLNGVHGRGLGGPAPGARMAPAAGQPPLGAGAAPRFALFAAPGEKAVRLLSDHADLLEATLRPPPSPGGLWLTRPDGYVACAVWEADAEAIADWLQTIRSG